MKIKDLMTRDVAYIHPHSSLKMAAQLMGETGIGSIPVVEDGQVVGVLTDHDIILRAVAAGINPADSTVAEIMTPAVLHCREEDDAEDAALLMNARHIRRVIVTNAHGGLAGTVALADLTNGVDVEDEGDATVSALVKGELAAVRTYRAALETLGAGSAVPELRRIKDEHAEAARLLRRRMSDPGRQAAGAPDPWRPVSEAVECASERFGDATVLKALKSGEELEILHYHQALDDERISPEVRTIVCETLLPRTWSHVSALERCLQLESSA